MVSLPPPWKPIFETKIIEKHKENQYLSAKALKSIRKTKKNIQKERQSHAKTKKKQKKQNFGEKSSNLGFVFLAEFCFF